MAEPFDNEQRIAQRQRQQQEQQREHLSADGLNAVSFFAIGVASEGGRNPYALEFAGNVRNGRMEPADNSGITIGNLQIDLGQRPAVATELVDAYQEWARQERPQDLLTAQQRQQAIADLGRDGDAIRADNGRPMNAVVQGRINTFLASESGINFVHRHDSEQAQELALQAYRPLAATRLYTDATIDDQIRMATVVGKLHNQNPREAGRILERAENGDFRNFDQLNNAVTAIGARYITSGRDDALEGAEVMIALRNSARGNPLRDDWGSVMLNPLVNPNQLDDNRANPNLPHQYAVVKELFIQRTQAPDFIEALDRGGAYRYGRQSADGMRFTENGLYASGNDFAIWNQRGEGISNANGEWREFSRDDLTRTRNRDGTIDLHLEQNGRHIELLRIDPQAPELRPAAPAMRGPGGRGGPDRDGPEQEQPPQPPRRAELISDPGFDALAHQTWLQTRSALDRSPIEGLDDLTQHQRERLTANVAARVVGDAQTGMTDVTRIDASTITNPQTGMPQFLIPGQGDPTTAHYKRVAVDVAQAIDTSVERSSEIAKADVEAREQKQAQDIAQAQTLNQDGPSGPTMKIGGRTIAMASSDSNSSSSGDGG
jgi:hypothetical protein